MSQHLRIPVEHAQAVADYLAQRPYLEVATLLPPLLAAPICDDPEPPASDYTEPTPEFVSQEFLDAVAATPARDARKFDLEPEDG